MEQYSGKATASLVFGIVSVVTFWLGWFAIISIISGILGIIFATQVKKAGQIEGFIPNGSTTAGFVLSIIGVVLGSSGFVLCVLCFGTLSLVPFVL